jgi:hypothetical protein
VVLWPAEVGDDRAAVDVDRDVDVWWREPRIEEEVEDGVFELAAGRGGAGGEDLGELVGAGAGAGDQVVLGLADGSSEWLVVELAGEVDQGAGWGGDRDALVVGGVRDRRAVCADASVPSFGRGGHFGVAVVPAHEPVQGAGRVVAEGGGRPAGLDRGQEAAFQWQVGVAHGVNPAVKEVQMPVAHAHFDRVAAQPARAQLVEREHAPLMGGEPGDLPITPSGRFVGSGPTK